MEGAQDAQAVLSAEQPRFVLQLVAVQETFLNAGCWVMTAGLLAAFGLIAAGLSQLAVLMAIGSILLAKWKWPTTTIQPIGQVLCLQKTLILAVDNEQTLLPISVETTLVINYQGYQNEYLAPKIRATGYNNYIELAGETYAFQITSEAVQHALRTELRKWYLQRVQLKEYRRGGRTVLLHKEPTYEQLQQFKSELGVSLYS